MIKSTQPQSHEALTENQEPKLTPVLNSSITHLTPEMLADDSRQLMRQSQTMRDSADLLIAKPANGWIEQAKTQLKPRMLFDEFWFEGELCILFADANLGKSILAVQIGNSISKGEPIKGLRLGAEKQMMLYFDFELSYKQFESRYSVDYEDHYHFEDHNFQRVELNPEAVIPDNQSFEDFLSECLERKIVQLNARILIIDNLTYLKNETEKAGNAQPLMKHLKLLKTKYNLSILALAHTPKRDLTKPIERNDLQGSKSLMNFTDSSFAIGESQRDSSLRYLKQIKVRQNEFIYDSKNVVVCHLNKPANFVQFEVIGFGSEREHLREVGDADNEKLKTEILELKNQGLALRQIATKLGTSHMKVQRVLNKL